MRLTAEQRKKVIEWAAEGLSYNEINARAGAESPPWGVTYKYLYSLRTKLPKKYQDIRDAFEREYLENGLAKKAARIQKLESLVEKLDQVIEERGRDEHLQEIPGGKTGLIVREYKALDLPVYKVDTAVIKEVRDLLRQIAVETGDWTEKKDVTSAGAPLTPMQPTINVYASEQQQSDPATEP